MDDGIKVHESVNHKLTQSLKQGQNQIDYLKHYILKEIQDYEEQIRKLRQDSKIKI